MVLGSLPLLILSVVIYALFLFYGNTVVLTNNLRRTYTKNILKEKEYCCSGYIIKDVLSIFFWKYLYCYCCSGSAEDMKGTPEEELSVLNKKFININLDQLKTFCQNYGQYRLKHNNFCIRCKQDHPKTTPVIFLIVLDWLDENTNLQNYHEDYGVSDTKDFRVDILHAAIDDEKRGLKRAAQTDPLNYRYKKGVHALKENSDSICLVLKDFPDHWEQTTNNEFLVQVASFINKSKVKLLYTW